MSSVNGGSSGLLIYNHQHVSDKRNAKLKKYVQFWNDLLEKMQHQYWVTKKTVLRKLGGKEDECIVSSDAELDAKLELFRSVAESCIALQRVIDLYQERLCYLAQSENTLGRYLKECGKNEKNHNAGQIMETVGKSLSYIGRQRLNIRPPLVRLHHEVETFRGRAVSDTRVTVTEMEKARTEYRAALSWMKAVSSQLDPDTGHGLERFRKAQSYVRTSKTRFDRMMLACLQKVDLLAAARCNMFSHALVAYQNAISGFSTKAADTLAVTVGKVNKVEAYDFCTVPELVVSTEESGDKDKATFFNAEYVDEKAKDVKKNAEKDSENITNLLGEDFSIGEQPNKSKEADGTNLSSELLDLSWPTTSALQSGGFLPSALLEEGSLLQMNQTEEKVKETPTKEPKASDKNASNVSWLSLFAELDPLANPDNCNLGDRA